MSQTYERLKQMKRRINEDGFTTPTGIGSEIPHYVFDYPAEDELVVRTYLEGVLKRTSIQIKEMNLFRFLLSFYEDCLNPKYQSTDEIPRELMNEMSKSSSIFASGPKNQKVFVNPNVQQVSKQIVELKSIQGSDIPRFVENPESYLPEIDGLDLSAFSERVKSLGIQVYRAQPYVRK